MAAYGKSHAARQLKDGLRDAGMTQKKLSQRLGLTPYAVAAWLARGRIPPGRARAIERILKKPAGWLLDLEWDLVQSWRKLPRGARLENLVDREAVGAVRAPLGRPLGLITAGQDISRGAWERLAAGGVVRLSTCGGTSVGSGPDNPKVSDRGE